MIAVRPAAERGATRTGWLDSRHSFSFANYFDLNNMGFRTLLVINDDHVGPGGGFPAHGHRDMEILTYVLDGAVEHQDSLGSGSIIRPGDIQVMSAGTGIRHSEFNPSQTDPLRLLQIWILPEREGLKPRYEQKTVAWDAAGSGLRLVGSHDGNKDGVTIYQDVNVHAGRLSPNAEATLDLAPGRHAWVQMARGAARVNGTALTEGDGAAIVGETNLAFRADSPAEFLVFDLG
ncbi:MAG: pirin family protein [Rhodospirillales bacterium]|nr:pirin family protein [Rhodospirillales bacterium]